MSKGILVLKQWLLQDFSEDEEPEKPPLFVNVANLTKGQVFVRNLSL